MKTSLSKIVSFSLLMLLVFVFPMSCSDQGVDKPESRLKDQTGQEDVPSVSDSWKHIRCDIANSLNPFDEAGVLHNEKLAMIESRCTADMTLAEVYKQADAVIQSDYRDEVISGFSAERFSTPILTALESDDGLPKYIASLNLSRSQQKEVLALVDIMYQYNAENLCDIISQIKEFETRILNLYGAKEMAPVLIGASIARYSLAYWDDRLEPENGGRTKINWKKLFVGVADVIGGVAGAVAGSATIVGGIAGGIVGAIGASAGAGSVWNVFAN